MNDLIILNKLPKLQQFSLFVCAAFLGIWSIYVGFTQMMASNLYTLFYVSIVGLIIAVFSILSVTIWLPKPIFRVSLEGIFPNLSNQSNLKPVLWEDMSDVNVGLNFLKITLKTTKTVNIDLSSLRYSDLKDVKSKIVELCESKNIPYRNA